MLQKRLVTVLLAAVLSVFTPNQVLAVGSVNRPQEKDQLPCEVIRDAFLWTLFKPIREVLTQYNDERQFMVDTPSRSITCILTNQKQ
ncbi:hypothetical protein [Paenibacillus donghaensis]|uniref:Uncharacterized protein n=1 Tax=Paenibacillus donghaensis TaxID=414771 RepID=A0A2Z2KGD5_9BACL|nr:hypothetical protein [Paenibacillus donghaensis]ASA24897.1 hypothetical protein B9T62_31570 [Paenibacillus donghaensis]